MDEKIVFVGSDGALKILTPVIPQYIASGELAPVQLTVEQIGQKDVPSGVPFWIVDAASIPADRTFRGAWELDVAAIGGPSGFGATYQPEGAA